MKAMSAGRNAPVLLSCDGIDVIAKFSAAECGVMGLVREAIVAMLAADLLLPVPNPVLVELIEDFAESLPEGQERSRVMMTQSVVPAFGSTRLKDGFFLWTADRTIPSGLLEQAAEIFAFDALVLNADRLARNPNCQFDGTSFAIFDHDLSLVTAGVGSFLTPFPWAAGALAPMADGPSQHLFYRGLKGKNASLTRLENAWKALPANRIDQYGNALPPTWTGNAESVTEALNYLRNLSQHVEAGFMEVRRVLS
jgi:hypothetical protein